MRAARIETSQPFFDTNLLLYAFSADARGEIARALLSSGGMVSVQVLNEFVSVARKKLKMPWGEVHQALGALAVLCSPALPLTLETHTRALDIAQRYQYQIYDALILSSALAAGCKTIYSEDMQHGQVIDGQLEIQDPFERV